jgi:hypothetical protein
MKKYILLILSIIILASCEEAINIPLDEADRRLVVEGLIRDTEGPHHVKLSWLKNFGDTTASDPAIGAMVTLRDDAGNSERLSMTKPGLYLTQNLEGVQGRTYYLEIEAEGKIYEAESILPPKGRLDSVLYSYIDDLAVVPEEGHYLRFFAQDDGSQRDYYLTQLYQNDTLYTDGALPYLIFDDRFAQGQYIPGFLVPFPLDSGKNVRLSFSTLTEEAYDFYFSLVQQTGSGSPFGAPPSNLPNNISNGALGFFRASGYLYKEGKLDGFEGKLK